MYEEQKDVQYPQPATIFFLTSFHLYIVIGFAGVFPPPFFSFGGVKLSFK